MDRRPCRAGLGEASHRRIDYRQEQRTTHEPALFVKRESVRHVLNKRELLATYPDMGLGVLRSALITGGQGHAPLVLQ